MYRAIVAQTCALLGVTAVCCAQNTNLVTRSTRAVGYTVGAGGTSIGFKATDLMPQAGGQAKVQAKKGYTEVEADFKQLPVPTKFGSEFLTYVLWAVSPDGRTSNLGEIVTDKQGGGKLKVSTQMQTFSLLVTAEPFFSARVPIELVILETRDTERCLVVNMPDVLFDTGKFTLRSETREKLARLTGIVINYPELRLESEGHTDNVGSGEFNQKLSQQRADSLREYMILQGVPQPSITSIARGCSVTVGSNDNTAGRQMNRRVELIVSGEIIGAAVDKSVQRGMLT